MTANFPNADPNLVDPQSGDPLSLSNGKASTQFVKDLNDEVEAIGSGVRKRTAGAIITPDAFSAQNQTVINNAEATTGWVATVFQTNVALSTFHTEGSNSIRAILYNRISGVGTLIYNLSSPLDVSTRVGVSLDILWGAAVASSPGYWRAFIASGTNASGTVAAVSLAGQPADAWATVTIPTEGLSSIQSVGIIPDPGNVPVVEGNSRTAWNIDNVVLTAESQLEAAIGSQSPVAVVVPPSYPAQAGALQYGDTKQIVDLRPASAVFGRHGGNRYAREFAIPEDGTTDVGAALMNAVNHLDQDQTLVLSSGASYLSNSTLLFNNIHDITIDGQGAAIFRSVDGSIGGHQIETTNCSNITFKNLRVYGWRKWGVLGKDLLNAAGSPTVSGNNKLLDAQNEEVYYPTTAYSGYLGRDKDGYFVNEWSLSDSSQVANDCVMVMADLDDPATILDQQTITLTGSQATYTHRFKVSDEYLVKKVRVSVKKATATANTITVYSNGIYHPVEYDIGDEPSSGFHIVTGSYGITIEDCIVENCGGDAIASGTTDNDLGDITVRRTYSRGCHRQGMSFNRGYRFLIEDCFIREAARSGIDIEPYSDGWEVHHLTIRNTRVWNVDNYALSSGHWARIFDVAVDGFDVYNAGLGVTLGGSSGVARNVTVNTPGVMSVPPSVDMKAVGQNMAFLNLSSTQGFQCYDEIQDGQTAGGNIVDGVTCPTGIFILTCPNTLYKNIGVGVGGTYQGGGAQIADGAAYQGVDLDSFTDTYPKSYKGTAFSSLWMPGGFNHLDDPVYKVRSLSGGATKGTNLRGFNESVTGTTKTITFPTKTLAAITFNALVANPTGSSSGTMTTGTYYYKVAFRDVYGGPRLPSTERSITLSAGQDRVGLPVDGFADAGNGFFYPGVTVYRGTSAGVYTARYDWVRTNPMSGIFYGTNGTLVDYGSTLDMLRYPATGNRWIGLPTATVQAGSFTPVDETGYEPDTNYAVFLEPSWKTTWNITARRRDGFDIEFGTSAPGGATVSWLIVR